MDTVDKINEKALDLGITLTAVENSESRILSIQARIDDAIARNPELSLLYSELTKEQFTHQTLLSEAKQIRGEIASALTTNEKLGGLVNGLTQTRHETLNYDQSEIVTWAITKAPTVLTINAKMLEKVLSSDETIQALEAPATRTVSYKSRISDNVLKTKHSNYLD